MGETKGMEQLLRQYLHEIFHLLILYTESAVYFVEAPVLLYIHIHIERRTEDVALRLFISRKTASFLSLKYDDFRIEHSEHKICTETCTYVLLFTEERNNQT